MEVLKDINGKESTKRKLGSRFLNFALGFAAIHYSITILLKVLFSFEIVKDVVIPFPTELWFGILGAGGGLIGVTLFEKIKP